jgi:hypothetical protein
MKIVSVILSLCFTAISATVSNGLRIHYSIDVETYYYATFQFASQAFLESSIFFVKRRCSMRFNKRKVKVIEV